MVRKATIFGVLFFAIISLNKETKNINSINILNTILFSSGEMIEYNKTIYNLSVLPRDYNCLEFDLQVKQKTENNKKKISLINECKKYNFLSPEYKTPAIISVYVNNIELKNDFKISKKINEQVNIRLVRNDQKVVVEEIR